MRVGDNEIDWGNKSYSVYKMFECVSPPPPKEKSVCVYVGGGGLLKKIGRGLEACVSRLFSFLFEVVFLTFEMRWFLQMKCW